MKRASYRHAIEWVAMNDDNGSSDSLDIDTVSSLISVALIADLFDLNVKKVALDVIKFRQRYCASSQK